MYCPTIIIISIKFDREATTVLNDILLFKPGVLYHAIGTHTFLRNCRDNRNNSHTRGRKNRSTNPSVLAAPVAIGAGHTEYQ